MSPREDVRNGSTPTVLLVHGAFADGSIWAEVIAELGRWSALTPPGSHR